MATKIGTLRGAKGRAGQSGNPGPDGPTVVAAYAAVTTDATGLVTIAFARPFTDQPVIVPDYAIAGDTSGYHIGVTDITTSGFTVWVRKHGARGMSNYAGNVTITYVASGQLA